MLRRVRLSVAVALALAARSAVADEPGGERLGAAREERDVGADEHERRAGGEVAVGGVRVERVDADGLARAAHGLERAQHGGHDVGVRLLAEQAHRRREVGRPDEDAVDAVDRGDLGRGIDPRGRLDLHEQRHVVVGVREVVVDAVPARRPGEGAADAAHAAGRVAHGGDRPRRACSAEETIGTSRFCAPRSSTCLIVDDVADRHAHDRRDG